MIATGGLTQASLSKHSRHQQGNCAVRLRLYISKGYRAIRLAIGSIFNCFDVVGIRQGNAAELRRHRMASAMRTIRPLDPSVAAQYPDNTVINSRYTIYNFVVFNLYEQFRRPLNLYFLLVACLQFISVIAPVSPLSTLLPLLFAFTLTALKEGYDDVKRHRQDAIYNRTKRIVLDPVTLSWGSQRNSRIRVGDVVLLHENEEIPCDVVVVAASAPTVYIRTDNLDGELDLKPREVLLPPNKSPSNIAGSEVFGDDESQCIHLKDSCNVLISKLERLRLTCPPPSAMVYSFDGRAEFCHARDGGNGGGSHRPTEVSISHHHLLPQSCVLKNTEAAICVAVYTGDETKCGMNKRPAPVKRAKIDQVISRYSIFVFCCQLVSALAFGVAGYMMNREVEKRLWYLQASSSESRASFIIYPLRFFLLTTVMIPVSFKFVVDMSKYYMAKTVEWDATMKHGGSSNEGCRVKNSGILEDLGQVDYILSDKTGTLTQNVMELLYVTIGNAPISLRQKEEGEVMGTNVPKENHVFQFGRALSLCNTVEVLHKPDQEQQSPVIDPLSVQYRASSPDEEALCRGSAKLHVRLLHRDAKEAVLDVNGQRETWTVHYVFPFSPELKSMGVLVERASTGDVYYYVKGADDRICELAAATATARTSASTSLLDSTFSGRKGSEENPLTFHLESYSMRGLRTLVVAEKNISRAQLQTFLGRVRDAELSVHDRADQLLQLRSQMEEGVHIMGVTAIEDKLQLEVPEKVQDFLQAGIKVWMLTGDKVQTAEQIGLACSLYAPCDSVLRIVSNGNAKDLTWLENMMNISVPPPPPPSSSSSPLETVAEKREHAVSHSPRSDIFRNDLANNLTSMVNMSSQLGVSRRGDRRGGGYNTMTTASMFPSRHVLVVEGGAVLDRILTTPELTDRFGALSDACVSVICARVTPSQKAAVTNLVRSRGFMTLAVGDGGNDVPMLQEAHVGVGIVGREGQQAARAADFSITRFADLHTLVFVHGQQAYTRTAYIIKYSFYKSMLISFIQLAYNIVGTYVSGGTFWNSFSLTLWNGMYTLPQTLFYCLDRIAPRAVLERNLFLYKMTRRGTDMKICEFFIVFLLRGIVQSLLTLWFVSGVFGLSFAFADTGGSASNDVVFSVAYSAMIISQMLTLLLESHAITFLNAFWIFGMPVLYVATTAIYSEVSNLQYFGVWRKTLNWCSFLAAFGIAFALVLPAFGLMVLHRAWKPDARDVLRVAAVRNWVRQRARNCMGQQERMPRLFHWLWCMPESVLSFVGVSSIAQHSDDP